MTIVQLPPLSFNSGGRGFSVLLSPSDSPITDPAEATRTIQPEAAEDSRMASKTPTPDPSTTVVHVPTHPIPVMQGAFAESLLEVTHTQDSVPVKPKLKDRDAASRREYLISQDKDEDPPAAEWRYRPGQVQHELWKLMAQISFGAYLLFNGLANSNDQVVNILQGHIDEIDEFLEVAMEDLEQATADLSERLEYLRVPMSNIPVFEKVLEDRNFRAELLENNEKIEHILTRTTLLLRQYEDDVSEGLRATKEFAQYLTNEQHGQWRTARPQVEDIYNAMKGNADGWYGALVKLELQSRDLDSLINDLLDKVTEMQRVAGEVSRRTWTNIQPFTVPLAAEGKELGKSDSFHSSRQMLHRAKSQPELAGSRSTIIHDAPPMPPNPFASPAGSTERAVATPTSDGMATDEDPAQREDGPLYILQPRTYTPQPPAPLPSPMVMDPTLRRQEEASVKDSAPPVQKRTSLRQRVSPPDSIHIPPPNISATIQQPRRTPNRNYQAPDSAYGSDIDQRNRGSSITTDLSPSIPVPHGFSPSTEHRTYIPVQASPHSSLQQRPHTSHNTPRVVSNPTPMSQIPPRNTPSRLGAASMLSNVTTMTYGTSTTRGDNEKRVKKKRSAFGWLRKAFSLDEEEKAAFEARRAQQSSSPYHEPRSQKFLDGKRIRH